MGKIEELIYVEGLRLCEEAAHSNLKIEAVIVLGRAFAERACGSVNSGAVACFRRAEAASVSEKLRGFDLVTRRRRKASLFSPNSQSDRSARLSATGAAESLIVVLHQINNPVNVGEMFCERRKPPGATGVITTKNTSDPFSPKSLRGAMGSASGCRFGVDQLLKRWLSGVANARSSVRVRTVKQPRIIRMWIGLEELADIS